MSIKIGDFKQAMAYQKQICEINEAIYDPKCHPLQPMQLYSLGKLQSQAAQTMEKPIQTAMMFQMAIESMTRALDTIQKFFGGVGRDGKTINQSLIDEVRSNIMANNMMIKESQKRLTQK